MLVFLKVPQMLVSLTTFPNFTNNVLRQVSQYLKKVMKFMTKLDKGKKKFKKSGKTKTFITNNVGLQKTITSKSTTSKTTKFVHIVF